jgi:hypothetical protein
MNPAPVPVTGAQGDGMIELATGKALEVNLKEDAQGRGQVVVTLQARGCAIDLTPHQARVLATELIMAVNRAEIRNNLKHRQSMGGSAQPGGQKRGLFNQAFAK